MSLRHNNIVSLRELSSFLGILVSANPGYLPAPLYYRKLQFSLVSQLSKAPTWDSKIKLSEGAISEITWWSKFTSAEPSPVSFLEKVPELVLKTDSSLQGWGAFLSNNSAAYGFWSEQDSSNHINFLELKAVFLSIQKFKDVLKGKKVEILTDSSSTLWYLRKMGGGPFLPDVLISHKHLEIPDSQ